MEFYIRQWTQDRYLIEPAGHPPILALFRSREAAERMADKLAYLPIFEGGEVKSPTSSSETTVLSCA